MDSIKVLIAVLTVSALGTIIGSGFYYLVASVVELISK